MKSGERISNRYKIIREIGSGGMANVFLAEDLILEREVAVKLMAYNFHNDEASIRRFKREALSTTELAHPNIVNVVDVGEEENQYIVMEYVEGSDLKEFIKEHYPIAYKKTINIMEQILDAVEYAHAHNIIHRDLKPQNILIDKDDTVKITDFGIAVALSENSITQTNSLLGSVHYVSPEQARGSMATKQSDIYSLGILLYELLTGEVPFDGESAVSIALKHFQNDMPSLRARDASIPQPLENVVLKATAKEAHQRYTSVREMKEDLVTALSPSRANEAKFEPESNVDDSTRILTPLPVTTPEQKVVASETSQPGKPTETANPSKDGEGNEKKKKSKKGVLSTIMLLLLVFVGYLIFSMTRPREVSIPQLTGLTLEEAEERLADLNLLVGEVYEEHNEDVDAGVVIRSSPDERFIVREEFEVDLYVSLGEESVSMEDYVGDNYEEVRAILTTLGFSVTSTQEFSDTVEAGAVLSQSVNAGEDVVPSETTVTLVVSSGPQGYDLRDLTGYTQDGVDRYATDLNLSVNFTSGPSNTVPEGQVASQSPDPGTEVFSGQRISVVISTGPEEPEYIQFEYPITVEYVALEEEAPETNDEETENDETAGEEEEAEEIVEEDVSSEPNRIEIYIDDANHSFDTVYREFDITKNTVVFLNFVVEEEGTASYRVYRDGELIMEESGIGPND